MAWKRSAGQSTSSASASCEVLEAALADPWAAGKTGEIARKGLHFADASEDLRLQYVMRLALMPFEGYVAFLQCNDPNAYEATYLRLLNALIARRLMAAESEFAFICCEENSKIRRAGVEACIGRAFDGLVARDDRRPKQYHVEFVSKPDLGTVGRRPISSLSVIGWSRTRTDLRGVSQSNERPRVSGTPLRAG